MSLDEDSLGELLDALEIGLELNAAAPAMQQLLDALTSAAPQAVVRQAAEGAVERLWDPTWSRRSAVSLRPSEDAPGPTTPTSRARRCTV